MTDTENTAEMMDTQLARLLRGARFFRNFYSLAQLGILLSFGMMFSEMWEIVAAASGVGMVGPVLMVLLMATIKSLPYLLLALAFRHLDNLFRAVAAALEELRATV